MPIRALEVLCVCWLLLLSRQASAARQLVDRIVAVIDNEVITAQELQQKAAPYLAQAPQIQGALARLAAHDKVVREVLDVEIGERLVNREIASSKDRLGVGDKDIDRAVEEVMSLNHLSREQLQTALYGQGLTWSEYRQKLRAQIERARLIQFKVQGKVQLKAVDVQRRCEQRGRSGHGDFAVCASHILLPLPQADAGKKRAAALLEAQNLRQQLADGADFAAYAARYSIDKGAPDGQLGCFRRGEMVESFDAAAFALPVGAISQVVETSFGLHIIKVSERRQAQAPRCDSPEALEPFRNELYQEEMQRQMQAWIGELKTKAFVDIRL